MKKALMPMLASLLLCGAATVALVAGSARAQPEQRKPLMVAMQTRPLPPSAAATDEADGMQAPHRHARLAPEVQRKQMCQDQYAHEIGTLAYLEAKLNLTAIQQPLFDRWKSARMEIAKHDEADCSTSEMPARNAEARPSPLEEMAREESTLKRRLADIDAERPVLGPLYNALSGEQKMALARPDNEMDGRKTHRRFFAPMAPRPDHIAGSPPGGSGGRIGGPGLSHGTAPQ